jgi:hypothetical protein
MAIESEVPSMKPSILASTSFTSPTSSSFLAFNHRKRLVQVATNNSATFIQFPRHARQASLFIPICHPRTSHSSTRLSSYIVETQSLSNQSKSSANAPTSSIASGDHKRSHSQQPTNPILTNSLLNHRKEQPKTPPPKEYSRTTRLCLSSRPVKPTLNNTQIPMIRASTAPVSAHQQEANINISDRLILPIDKKTSEQQQQTQYLDDNKYDYITRWLNEVRAATYSKEALLLKAKRTKRRLIPA